MTASAPERPPRFSVVIPTLRRPGPLAAALDSLAACAPPPAEVVVVDGEDAGGTRELVASFGGRSGIASRYLVGEPGPSRQRNVGIAAAEGDVVVFADDDVVFGRDAFAALARAYADPSVVGATGRVHEPKAHRLGGREASARKFLPGGGAEGRFTRFGYPRYLVSADRPRDVEVMQGCFMSARLAAARAVGFDESLVGYALGEDEDFSLRLSRLGRLRYVPEASIEHRKLGFLHRDSRAFNRMVVVNRRYLFRKNFPQSLLARAQFGLFLAALFVHRLVNADWSGARGLVDGVRESRRTGGTPVRRAGDGSRRGSNGL